MEITFRFKVERSANFYFFVQNLSEWEPWARLEANEFWRTSLAIPEDVIANLKDFASIHRMYQRPENFLGRWFFGYKDPWKQLRRSLRPKEFEIVRNAFSACEPFFNRLWIKEEKSLRKWQFILTKRAAELRLAKKIIPTLASLYGVRFTSRTVTSHLLLSAPNYLSGTSGRSGDASIIMEISRFPKDKPAAVLGLLWHETIHCLFDRQFKRLASKTTRKADGMRIHEIAAGSLFPRGPLGQRALGTNPPNNRYFRDAPGMQENLFGLMQTYIDQERALDRQYVKEVAKIKSRPEQSQGGRQDVDYTS